VAKDPGHPGAAQFIGCSSAGQVSSLAESRALRNIDSRPATWNGKPYMGNVWKSEKNSGLTSQKKGNNF
jgi:hypothetical protein